MAETDEERRARKAQKERERRARIKAEKEADGAPASQQMDSNTANDAAEARLPLVDQLLAQVREKIGDVEAVPGPKLRIRKGGVTLAYVAEQKRGGLRVDSRSPGRSFNVGVASSRDVSRAASEIENAAQKAAAPA